jgi:hypothetical protein
MFACFPVCFVDERVHSLSIEARLACLGAMAREIRPPRRDRPLVRFRLDFRSDKNCEECNRKQLRSVLGRFAAAGWIGDATDFCIRLGTHNGFAGVPAGYWLDAVGTLPVGRPHAVLVWDFEQDFQPRPQLRRCQADGIADTARACLALDLRVDVLIQTDRPDALIPAEELRKAMIGRSVVPDGERNIVARGDRLRIACTLRDGKLSDHPGDVDREMRWYT